ncbi:MAG: hypothetical protein HBSAPP03_20340 [Phycisphaerae bacterium]|nr:MAG: hypothetical protein HBSAPP03_20340 [Phycisphaerae bacterium]
MVIGLLSIAMVLLIGYIWVLRGFLSALIHLVATLIAGAVAFAFWEKLALMMLDGAQTTGWLAGSAWAIALVGPFAVTLMLIRPALDRIIRANVAVNPTVDYVAGGALGALSGVISVGILTIGLSYMRVDYLGSQSFTSGGTGNVEREGGLFVPFDKITLGLYGALSERGLRVEEPLAKWRPTAHEQGNANRMSAFDGTGRNTFRPEDFDVRARFTVGDGRSSFADLTRDMWDSNPQSVTDPDGNPYPSNSTVEGFVVVLKAGAKEKDGQAAVGNAQVQLLLENDAGERMMVFPFAVSSQAQPQTPGVARWRYNAMDVFIASVGGASEATFAFEFPCPPGFKPYALYVKGIRHRVDQGATAQPRAKFANAAERDAGFASLVGDLARTGSAAVSSADVTIRPDGVTVLNTKANTLPEGITQILRLPWNITIQLGSHGQLELAEEGQGNYITGGEMTIAKSELPTALTEKGIKVENFIADRSTVLVQMEVSANSRTSILGGAISAAENVLPPVLVDTLGEAYQPVGFAYMDESVFKMRFTPNAPITAMSQLPSLSRSRPAQRLVLFFRISLGREVKSFNKGSKVVYEFNPPFKCDTVQMNRR